MIDRKEETHPSYVLVGFSRIQRGPGRTPMFGSAIDDHHTTVELTIRRASVTHDSRDWYHAGDELIQVEFSAAQFSELLTTMNVGSGVPATLRRLNREPVEDPPFRDVEAKQVRTAFDKKISTVKSNFSKTIEKAKELLKNPRPKKADREEILRDLERAEMELGPNTKYALECFQEATEKIITTAKAEADAFLTAAINNAGLKALAAGPSAEERIVGKMLASKSGQVSFEGDEAATFIEAWKEAMGNPRGTTCSKCGRPQYDTPNGIACSQRHLDAPALEGLTDGALTKLYLKPCSVPNCRAKTMSLSDGYCHFHGAVMTILKKREEGGS